MPNILPGRLTITRNAQYGRVYDGGVKLVGRYLIMFHMPKAQAAPGVGITVSRKVGGAVRRNLVRRRIKEALRQTGAGPLAEMDTVFVALTRIRSATFTDIMDDITKLVSRVSRGA